jgi:hypothetical protein
MKPNLLVRLATGCVLALGLCPALHAQDQKTPLPGTFISAKDPDTVPLPFNPHPELEAVEVDKGIFVVDDTALPDTKEQIIARAARQAASELAKSVDPKVAKAEREAAKEMEWKRNREKIAPWLHQAKPPVNGELSVSAIDENERDEKLRQLAATATEKERQNRQEVKTFALRNKLSEFITEKDGRVSAIVKIEDGIPRVYVGGNVEAADTVSTDELWTGGNTGMNLNGTNVSIGMWDVGDPRTSHREFSTNGQRITIFDGTSSLGTTDHSTSVAGVLAAYGVTASAKGMAHRARVFAGDYIGDLAEMPAVVSSNKLRISNHSYGLKSGWDGTYYFNGTDYPVWWGDVSVSTNEDYHFGFYDSTSSNVDAIVYAAVNYLPVWNAQNERGAPGQAPTNQPVTHLAFVNGAPAIFTGFTRPNDGDAGGYDTLPSHGVAKNILTVGAVNQIASGYTGSNSVTMSSFSSFGPTDDGRIKPDLVACGVLVYTTGFNSDSDYYTFSGTSEATPGVAGSLGLLVQLQNQLYGTNQPMLSSTLRGLAIHTADEAGTNAGPDYRFGWGLFNARSAALLITNNYASQSLPFIKEVNLASGDYIEFPVIATNTQPLRVTICWTDPAGNPPSKSLDPTNRMLVNDFDLRLTRAATTNFPWVLSPTNRTAGATTGDNKLDNVEQVSIPAPTSGEYLVRVTHKGNLVNSSGAVTNQLVSILVSGNLAQSQSPFVVSGFSQVSSNTFSLQWNSTVGRYYQVRYSDSLTNSSWSNSTGEISATKTNVAVILIPGTNTPNRFYRVVQVR